MLTVATLLYLVNGVYQNVPNNCWHFLWTSLGKSRCIECFCISPFRMVLLDNQKCILILFDSLQIRYKVWLVTTSYPKKNMWAGSWGVNMGHYHTSIAPSPFHPHSKGQLISKANCQAVNSSKKWTNEFVLLVCDVFLFVFWKKLKTSKKLFEIVWPLAKAHLLYSSFIDGWSSDKSGVDSSPF